MVKRCRRKKLPFSCSLSSFLDWFIFSGDAFWDKEPSIKSIVFLSLNPSRDCVQLSGGTKCNSAKIAIMLCIFSVFFILFCEQFYVLSCLQFFSFNKCCCLWIYMFVSRLNLSLVSLALEFLCTMRITVLLYFLC